MSRTRQHVCDNAAIARSAFRQNINHNGRLALLISQVHASQPKRILRYKGRCNSAFS